MPTKIVERNAADYIVPLAIGGLEGRMLHIPAEPKNLSPTQAKREILFVYGHHSTLERWWGLMEVFNQFGAVTMPDLPGFGGMESFYKVGQKPTIDAMADYLAAFIKWRYKRKKVTVVGMSFGFVVLTRMLQRYPELTNKIEYCISLAGFAHEDDFQFPKWKHSMLLAFARTMTFRLPSFLVRALILRRPILRTIYRKTDNEKFRGADDTSFERQLEVEVGLWRLNDLRTAGQTSAEFLKLNNCNQQIKLPVYQVGVVGDRYFDNHNVEQHFRIIFSDFHLLATLDLVSHAPSVIATADEAASFVPAQLRQLLS